MNDCMTFPDTVEEFMENYKIVDTDGIYMSKGAELVPIFRMRQWFEHLLSVQPEIVRCKDCKYFEYDHPCMIQGVPVLGHLVCIKWGNGCRTDEDGFCFMGERKDG